jgi:hypothetical protein
MRVLHRFWRHDPITGLAEPHRLIIVIAFLQFRTISILTHRFHLTISLGAAFQFAHTNLVHLHISWSLWLLECRSPRCLQSTALVSHVIVIKALIDFMTSSLDRLPFDLLFYIASNLQLEDVVHLSQTCRQLNTLLEERTLQRCVVEVNTFSV